MRIYNGTGIDELGRSQEELDSEQGIQ